MSATSARAMNRGNPIFRLRSLTTWYLQSKLRRVTARVPQLQHVTTGYAQVVRSAPSSWACHDEPLATRAETRCEQALSAASGLHGTNAVAELKLPGGSF
jgi:hypothetical protein